MKLKKILSFTLISVVLLSLLAGCGKKGGELNLFTWEGYVPDDVVADFEKETGIRVNYNFFNDNDEMYGIYKQQKGSYDVIICSDYIIDTMRAEGGLIKKLDKSKLPNFKNIDPFYQGSYYDPDDEYAIPYSSAAALLVYDSAKVTEPIRGYADLWNPAFKDSITCLNSIRDMLGITLMMQSRSINETDEAAIKAAGQKLMELKPNISVFGSALPGENIISGEASIGYMFGSDAAAVAAAIPTAKYVYPEEGFILYVDNIVLCDNAPNEANALAFMNYLMDAKVSAKISNEINYPSTNTAARPYLSDEFRNNLMVNVPHDVLANHQVMRDVGAATPLYDELWTEFKSGK